MGIAIVTFSGTAHENVGFRGRKGQKVHPNFAPNITMEFHYHGFCDPEIIPLSMPDLNPARDQKKGSLRKGISKISRFSRISRKWSDSPLFSTVWGFSKISRISKFSRISRKWTFLKRPLF